RKARLLDRGAVFLLSCRAQSRCSRDFGSGSAARGLLCLDLRLTCRKTSRRIAAATAAHIKNRGGAELLIPTIKRTTTIRARAAVPIVIDERKVFCRSFWARSS